MTGVLCILLKSLLQSKMEIDLLTVISHPNFVMSNKCSELKKNIWSICEKLTGFHPKESSLESQTIALRKRLVKARKGLAAILNCKSERTFLSSHKVILEEIDREDVRVTQQVKGTN